jgi:DNA polymerase-3 subunit beta
MDVIINKEQLKEAVQLADKMAGKQLTLPALRGLLFTAASGAVTIRATNLNVGIEIDVSASISSEGSVVLRGEVLGSVLSNIRENEVRLVQEGENITIETKTSKNLLKALPNDDFPTLPDVQGEQLTLPTEVLRDGIRSVYFAAATTDIKPEIASIFIYSDSGSLVFVATDSFRLAEKKVKLKNPVDVQKILLPYKNIPDILRVLDGALEQIVVTFDAHQLSLRTKTIYFTTRLIDGGFPDYRIIIPKEEKTKIVVLRQELLSTLRLANMFVDNFSQLTLTVDPGQKTVRLSSTNTDIGKSESVLDAVITGNPIEVACNSKYLLDVFQALSDDSIALSFTEANKAIVVRGVHDDSFLYLLMPSKR